MRPLEFRPKDVERLAVRNVQLLCGHVAYDSISCLKMRAAILHLEMDGLSARCSLNKCEFDVDLKDCGFHSWEFLSHQLTFVYLFNCFLGKVWYTNPAQFNQRSPKSSICTVAKVDVATPTRWRFVRGHDKPIYRSYAVHFPGGITSNLIDLILKKKTVFLRAFLRALLLCQSMSNN